MHLASSSSSQGKKKINVMLTNAKLSNSMAGTVFSHHYHPFEKHIVINGVKNVQGAIAEQRYYEEEMYRVTANKKKVSFEFYAGEDPTPHLGADNFERRFQTPQGILPQHDSIARMKRGPFVYNIFHMAPTPLDHHRFLSNLIKDTEGAELGDVVLFDGHNTRTQEDLYSLRTAQQIIDIYRKEHESPNIYTYQWRRTTIDQQIGIEGSELSGRIPSKLLEKEREEVPQIIAKQLWKVYRLLKTMQLERELLFEGKEVPPFLPTHRMEQVKQNQLNVEEAVLETMSDPRDSQGRAWMLDYVRKALQCFDQEIRNERFSSGGNRQAVVRLEELVNFRKRTMSIVEHLEDGGGLRMEAGGLWIATAHVKPDFEYKGVKNTIVDDVNVLEENSNGDCMTAVGSYKVTRLGVIKKAFLKDKFNPVESYVTKAGKTSQF